MVRLLRQDDGYYHKLESRKGSGSDGATLREHDADDRPISFIKIGEEDEYSLEVARALFLDHILSSSSNKYLPLRTPKLTGFLKRPHAGKLNELFERDIFRGDAKYLASKHEHIDAEVDKNLIETNPKRYAQAVVRALRKLPKLPINQDFVKKHPDQKIFQVKTFEKYREDFEELARYVSSFVAEVDFFKDILNSNKLEPDDLFSKMTTIFNSYEQLGPDELCFTHGDFSWHNLTVKFHENPEDDEVWVYDLEKSYIGIIWEDWARFLNYSKNKSEQVYDEVWTNLTADEKKKVRIFQIYKILLLFRIHAMQFRDARNDNKKEIEAKLGRHLLLAIALVKESELESKT